MSERVTELLTHVTHLDTALRVAEPREVAALLRERRITLAEIAALGGVEKGSVIDELANRRKDRQSTPDVAPKPSRSKQ